MYKGELISITVTLSWTICAMFAEVASKRMGSLPFNVVRMFLSLLLLCGVLWWFLGSPWPVGAGGDAWLWLSLSGLVGYVLGDFCLFNSYILIGSRRGQLLMTLAPPSAALFGWLLLGQGMTWLALLGMCVTVGGIGLALSGRAAPVAQSVRRAASFRGVLYGVGAAVGQGVGLVLSAKGLLLYGDALRESGTVILHGGTPDFVLPFAATAIRAVTGLLGFALWTLVAGQLSRLRTSVRDAGAMLCAVGATITGPFVGVSLSLMATLYTSVGVAQTIMAMTPVLIIWPTYLLFRQRITWREVVGAVVSVAGVSLFFL